MTRSTPPRSQASTRTVVAARICLGLLAIYGLVRVVDTEARWAAGRIPGDVIEHALIVYALLIGLLAGFPRLPARVAVPALLALGAGVELLQAIPGVPGGFQARDLLADVLGVLLALAPFLAGRQRAATAE